MIIGINGLKTSGKDTTYEIIADLREGVKRAAFADKLKIMAMRALGFDGSPAALIEKANRLKEDGGYVSSSFDIVAPLSGALIPDGEHITGREYLQRFGGHARELFGENFWVDQVLPLADGSNWLLASQEMQYSVIDPWTLEPRGDFNILCITDVRYLNEAARVLDLTGETWEIVRPGLTSDGHASETPLPDDCIIRQIINDGDLDTLREKVAAALDDAEACMGPGTY